MDKVKDGWLIVWLVWMCISTIVAGIISAVLISRENYTWSIITGVVWSVGIVVPLGCRLGVGVIKKVG